MHLRLNNIIKTYNADTASFDRQDKYYPLEKCNKENFNQNEFEKQYYELKKSRHQYCVDQLKDVYLQGTRDSEVLKQDHAYITVEVWRCSDKTKEANDPPCKPERMMHLKDGSSTDLVDYATLVADGADLDLYVEDLEADTIDNFLRKKKATFKVLNQKIDFTTFDKYAVRYNEVFIPTVDLAYPNYSDTGYRFRYNIFDRADGYFYPIDLENVFFDYFEYNTDTFQSAPKGSE